MTKLDRLGRSLEDLIELSKDLLGRGVGLVVLDQGIDNTTAIGRMFFQVLVHNRPTKPQPEAEPVDEGPSTVESEMALTCNDRTGRPESAGAG